MSSAAVLPAAVHDRLRRRYGLPPRAYHSFTHAARVAALARELGGSRACLLAAWFHDAVYEPGATDNESRSAELLQRWLPDDPDAATAAALVRTTETHLVPAGDVDAAVLCDADLAVLGRDPAAYARYVLAVRTEYAHVTDEVWRKGRARVLRTLLDRPVLFHTAAGHARWEEAARRNMHAELKRLTAG